LITSALRPVVIDIGLSFSCQVFTVGGRAGMSSSAVTTGTLRGVSWLSGEVAPIR